MTGFHSADFHASFAAHEIAVIARRHASHLASRYSTRAMGPDIERRADRRAAPLKAPLSLRAAYRVRSTPGSPSSGIHSPRRPAQPDQPVSDIDELPGPAQLQMLDFEVGDHPRPEGVLPAVEKQRAADHLVARIIDRSIEGSSSGGGRGATEPPPWAKFVSEIPRSRLASISVPKPDCSTRTRPLNCGIQ